MLRVVTRRPSVAARAKTSSSGLSSRAPLAMRTTAPSVMNAVLSAITASWPVALSRAYADCGAVSRLQRRRQRRDLQPRGSAQGRKLRRMQPVDEHHAVGVERGQLFQRRIDLGRRRLGRVADGRGERLLQRAAQVGPLPLLDAPVRQAERREGADGRLARLRHGASARQLRGDSLEAVGERLLHLGPCQCHGHVVSLASSTLEGLALELGVAGLLELQRQLLAAGLADLAAGHHVHLVRHDVVQAAAGSG